MALGFSQGSDSKRCTSHSGQPAAQLTMRGGRVESYALAPSAPGDKITVDYGEIRYTRDGTISKVEFLLNDKVVSMVNKVGIPLDKQDKPYTGVYPSYGPGEVLSVNSFSIGHGLFSLLDAFPFQHPDRPDLAVSIPVPNRLFGQGAYASFERFTVETVDFD